MITDSITQHITRWCHLKTWPPPIITSRTGPLITMRNVHENKAIHIHSLENLSCPSNHEQKFSQNIRQSWKFKLSLLSRGKVSTKIRSFLYIHLKIRPAPIITSWNIRKNKAVLLMWFENLHFPYYQELKFSQK